MPHPRIGRASEERVASKKSLEVLDDNPVRGEVALTDAECAEPAKRDGEKNNTGEITKQEIAQPTPA